MSLEWRPTRMRGIYEDQLWDFVSSDDLRLQRSPSGSVRYPPGPVCPETLDPEYSWESLRGEGTLLAWTVFRRAYFPRLPIPYTVVAVKSDDGPIFVGHLSGDASSQLRHGMAMQMVYEDVAMDETPTRIFNWIPSTQNSTLQPSPEQDDS